MNELISYSFDLIEFKSNIKQEFIINLINFKWIGIYWIILSIIEIISNINISVLSFIVCIILFTLSIFTIIEINKDLEEINLNIQSTKFTSFYYYCLILHVIDMIYILLIEFDRTFISFWQKDYYEKFMKLISILFALQRTFFLLLTVKKSKDLIEESKII